MRAPLLHLRTPQEASTANCVRFWSSELPSKVRAFVASASTSAKQGMQLSQQPSLTASFRVHLRVREAVVRVRRKLRFKRQFLSKGALQLALHLPQEPMWPLFQRASQQLSLSSRRSDDFVPAASAKLLRANSFSRWLQRWLSCFRELPSKLAQLRVLLLR